MKEAVTLSQASSITEEDVFDVEAAYESALTVTGDSSRLGKWHPSAIGMCGRMNAYVFQGVKHTDNISTELAEIFSMGHAVHGMVQSVFEKDIEPVLRRKGYTYKFQAEVPCPAGDHIKETYGMGGTTDGILDIEKDGVRQRMILEVKSIGDSGFQRLRGPKEEHLEQATIYANRWDCPIILIWYVCKNNSKRSVYKRIYDPAVFTTAMAKVTYWLDCLENGILPPREEDFFSCKECMYRSLCKPKILEKNKAQTFKRRV